MDPSHYIATELLEIIIDELGAEAEILPTSSPALQTLLNLSLTGRRALPRCQMHLFSVLTFDSAEKKERKWRTTPGWKHLQTTVEMLEEKPQYALYIRHLRISLYCAFPTDINIRPNLYDPQSALDYGQKMLPRILDKLRNLESFILDAHGWRSSLAAQHWYKLQPDLKRSMVTLLGRSQDEGNVLKEVALSHFMCIPKNILNDLPSTVHTLRLGLGTLVNAPPMVRAGYDTFNPRKWKFRLRELDIQTQYAFIEALVPDATHQLAKLEALSCFVQNAQHSQLLKFALRCSRSNLRSLDISTWGSPEGRTFWHSLLTMHPSLTIDARKVAELIERTKTGVFDLPRLQNLSLATQVEDFLVPRPAPRCPSIIPKFYRHMTNDMPALQTLSLHALWNFNSVVDATNVKFFYPNYGWSALVGHLSRKTPCLATIRVRATLKTVNEGFLSPVRQSKCPELPEEWLKRANREMRGVFKELAKKLSVELWEEPDKRLRGQIVI